MIIKSTDNYEQLIAEVFQNDIQIKRLTKELQMLKELKKDEYKMTLQTSSDGLNILVELNPELLLVNSLETLNGGRPITFMIRLDSKFPFAFPRVYSLSRITQNPSLSDGRDYIEDVIMKPWCPSVLLSEIVMTLPKFLKTISENEKDKNYLFDIGKFHLDQQYDISDQALFEDVEIYPCKDLQDNSKATKKYLQVSRGYIVVFESVEKSTNMVTLSSYQNLNNLINIRRKQKTDDTIVLTWKDNVIKDGRIQVFSVQNCDACVDTIISNMKQSGVKVSKNHTKVGFIPESEVSMQQFQAKDIELMLVMVQSGEEQLEEEITFPAINNLMEAYQRVIEYYSALDQDNYEEYVIKLKALLARKDVQDLLDLQYQLKRTTPEEQKVQFQEE